MLLKMKIFNWVHRRLNGPTSLVAVHRPQTGHEVEMIKDRSMVKLSVPDHQIEEALLNWEDGLLAIGTIGFQYAHHPPHHDFILNPRFSFRNSSNSVFDTRDSVCSDDQEYPDATTYMRDILAGENDGEDPLLLNAAYNHHEIEAVDQNYIISLAPFQHVEAADLHDISSHSIKSDRTTLSDLFKAEPNDSLISKKCLQKCSPAFTDRTNKEDTQIMAKPKKFTSSFSAKPVKKLFPGPEVQVVQPIKLNINHMMRKMIKRKIHPELTRQKSTTSKMENQVIPPLSLKDEIDVNEGISLLQSAENMHFSG